jgi:hypothetical protein
VLAVRLPWTLTASATASSAHKIAENSKRAKSPSVSPPFPKPHQFSARLRASCSSQKRKRRKERKEEQETLTASDAYGDGTRDMPESLLIFSTWGISGFLKFNLTMLKWR